MLKDSPVIIALDYADEKLLWKLVEQLTPAQCKLKIGKEVFTHYGPQLVKKLVAMGFDVFLDLKFHDIPNTVAKACLAAADLGVWMVNVHASGGEKMMATANTALLDNGYQTHLIAVTVLTSMDQVQLNQVVPNITPEEQVIKLTNLAAQVGLAGVVCSAQEASLLRQQHPSDFLLVTPGIRPAGSSIDDQQRIMTPTQAMLAGVNYMVIGRPITQSQAPALALASINQSVGY